MNARRTDPQTSHEAGERIESSRKAQTHRELILELLTAYPGTSSKGLFRIASRSHTWPAEIDLHEIRRRLPELRKEGKAHVDGRGDDGQLNWPGPKPTTQKELF